MKSNNNFIIYGHIIHSNVLRQLEFNKDSYLVCINGRSMGIYKELPNRYSRLPIANYENCLVMPGMVDLHIHASQFAFRGMGMDWELIDWLNNQTFPEEARYADLDYADSAYGIFTNCIKKSATTRAVMFATCHKDSTILLMDKMEKSGVVSYVGKVNMDREASDIIREANAFESALNTEEWLKAIDGKYNRTMPILTPRFIPSCSNELLKKLQKIRYKHHLHVQSHLSENPDEIKWVKALIPDSEFYGDAYDRYDLFGDKDGRFEGTKTVMAHCVWSENKELERIKKNGVFIAHCPSSNMNLASGIAPVKKYIDMQLHIGLGSDVAGGQTESIFRAITDAVQVSKMYWRYVDNTVLPLTFEDAFALATRCGGEFFGKVGAFDEGFEFDALVVDDSKALHPDKLTLRQRLERAVYLGLDRDCITAKYVYGDKIL